MSYRISASNNAALAFVLGAALVGGAFGFTADRLVTRDRICPRWGDDQAMRRRFGDELNLSANQRAAVDTILTAKHRAIQALVKPIRPELDSISDDATRQIKARLDPDQQVTFDRMYADMKAQQAAADAKAASAPSASRGNVSAPSAASPSTMPGGNPPTTPGGR
jgi:hypothetical protein